MLKLSINDCFVVIFFGKWQSSGALEPQLRVSSAPPKPNTRRLLRVWGSSSAVRGRGNRPSFWRCKLPDTHHDLAGSSHEKFSPHRLGHVTCRLSMVAHGTRTCPWKEDANSLNIASAASNASRQRTIADAPRLNSSVGSKLFRTNKLATRQLRYPMMIMDFSTKIMGDSLTAEQRTLTPRV